MALNRCASSDCGPYRCPCRDPSSCPMYRSSYSACASIPPASICKANPKSQPTSRLVGSWYRLYQRFTRATLTHCPMRLCGKTVKMLESKRNAIKINGISGNLYSVARGKGAIGLVVSGERNACTHCSYRIFVHINESLIRFDCGDG